jgi:hypothetical protein
MALCWLPFVALAAPTAWADGVVHLEVRQSPSTPEYTVELIEVKTNADGTTTDVPVKDRDGTPIKGRMDKLGDLAKPETTENPEGGRVSEDAEDRRKSRVSLTLPAGNYRFRITNDKTGEVTETGKFVVPEGAGTKQKGDDGKEIRIRPVKLTMSGKPVGLYIPEGYRVAQAGETDLEPGQEYAAAPGDSGPFRGFEIALTPGGSFGSIGTRQRTSFSGKATGDDIHYEAANLHADVRFYLGDIGGLAFFQPELFVGLKGSVTFGGGEQGLEEDNHPPAGVDSFVNYEIGGTLTPHLGLVVADFDCARVNLLVGPRITFAEITGKTDESGGGGVEESFDRNVVQVGPAAGVELDLPLPREWYEGLDGGARVAVWGEYLPGVGVSGDSSTFPFDYRFGTQDAFLFTVRMGMYLRFDGP